MSYFADHTGFRSRANIMTNMSRLGKGKKIAQRNGDTAGSVRVAPNGLKDKNNILAERW